MNEESVSWCWLVVHSWDNWKDLDTWKILAEDKKWVGTKYIQERRCKHCNKLQVNEQEVLL